MSRHARGAALLLVMWLIALLTALVGGFALLARTENMQGRVLFRGVAASNAARAGVEYALTRVRLGDTRRQWRADGRTYHWRYADAQVDVRIVDEDGKVDLNQADATFLTNFLRAVGIEQAQAGRLAGAIVDWRDADLLTQPSGGAEDADYEAAERPYGAKDGEFESIAELEQILGFTPELYAKVAPYVTVYSGRPTPEPAFAAAPVLTALGLDGERLSRMRDAWNPANGVPAGLPAELASSGTGSGTYSIESTATLADGRSAVLRTVVRSGGGALPGMAYTPLRWEEGPVMRVASETAGLDDGRQGR